MHLLPDGGRCLWETQPAMIDQFAILLSHGLMALAGLRLLFRDDFDRTPPDEAGGDAGKDSSHAA
jgi:hypothetical protein